MEYDISCFASNLSDTSQEKAESTAPARLIDRSVNQSINQSMASEAAKDIEHTTYAV